MNRHLASSIAVHPFPKVYQVARLLRDARRRAGVTALWVARRLPMPRNQANELLARSEAGCFPFLSPQVIDSLVRRIGLDREALFLAQCDDFYTLDKPQPRLLIEVDFGTSQTMVEVDGIPQESENLEQSMYWAEICFADERAKLRKLLGKEPRIRGWLAQSHLRSFRLMAPGWRVISFRPPNLKSSGVAAQWLALWEQSVVQWLGSASSSRSTGSGEGWKKE